jgi:3-oxoacyl-[acyl-carrier-protein] synthase-3
MEATARKLGIPLERLVGAVREHGNTSAASIPLALNQAYRDGRICRGDKVLMHAVGAGVTWGAVATPRPERTANNFPPSWRGVCNK